MQQKQSSAKETGLDDIANSFVGARLKGVALPAYPGQLPRNLEDAYQIQDHAIKMWPDSIEGWKVGRILGEQVVTLGTDRLAGPIFNASIQNASPQPTNMPAFKEGFAAVEGEVVIFLGKDAPSGKVEWTTDEAVQHIGSIVAGIEIASSPFNAINDHGPLVTISDFGNNFGLILGQEIPDWKQLNFQNLQCKTYIDDVLVGSDNPANIPGGPVESLRFLLSLSAQRGMPLKKGMAISTGAVTGVHELRIGQLAKVVFQGVQPISCVLTEFSPESTTTLK